MILNNQILLKQQNCILQRHIFMLFASQEHQIHVTLFESRLPFPQFYVSHCNLEETRI